LTLQQVPIASAYSRRHVTWNADLHQCGVVADTGIILTSSDGIDWIIRGSGTLYTLTGIVWANGQYVVVGTSGTVLTSPDGINWTDHTPSSGPLTIANPSLHIAWNASTFVVTSSGDPDLGDTILTSSNPADTQSWNIVFSDPSYGAAIDAIVWDNSAFVAIGSNGVVVTSPNGSDWTTRESGTSDELNVIAFNSERILTITVNSTFLTSPLDGTAWAKTFYSFTQGYEEFTNAVWTGSEFAATSDAGSFYTSANGLDWTPHYSLFSIPPTGIAWGNNQFVVVGNGDILTSQDDGATWTSRADAQTANVFFRAVTWGNNQFVAVGSYVSSASAVGPKFGQRQTGVIYTSTDGENWTSPANTSVVGDKINSVVWGGSQFVAIGGATNSNGSFAPTPVFTSPNGVDWTRRTLNDLPGPSFKGIAWSGNGYVAVGLGTNLDPRGGATSADAVHWDYISFPRTFATASTLQSVVWTGNRFITVGEIGTALSSSDGRNWTDDFMGTFSGFNAIVTNGTRCIAVGSASTIMLNDAQCDGDPIFKNGFEPSP